MFKKSLNVYDTWFGFYGDFKKGTLACHKDMAALNGLIDKCEVVTYVHFLTLMKDAEAHVNVRPLLALSEENLT